jgi:hypothetical protein
MMVKKEVILFLVFCISSLAAGVTYEGDTE